MPKLVLLSDTHLTHETHNFEVPEGDILIHAGDLTRTGSLAQIEAARDWLLTLPHPIKIVIAGNHDWSFEKSPQRARAAIAGPGITYLEDSGVELFGLKIWGSPWSLEFCNWAFMDTSRNLEPLWKNLPDDLDILITHGPAYGIGDRVVRGGFNVGCPALRKRIEELENLKLHVTGHIHEGYGMYQIAESSAIFVNAATCNLQYLPLNPPVVLDL